MNDIIFLLSAPVITYCLSYVIAEIYMSLSKRYNVR